MSDVVQDAWMECVAMMGICLVLGLALYVVMSRASGNWNASTSISFGVPMTRQDKFNFAAIPVAVLTVFLAFLAAWLGWV